MSYRVIAKGDEIPIGEMKKYVLEDLEILVVNIDGEFHAINSRCTHMGGDLSEGELVGNIVQCPRHGSKFNVITGEAIHGPKILILKFNTENIRTYETKFDGKNVMIKI